MKKSTAAVLLSGLVLPGAGHFMLKKPVRGIALCVLSLAALSVVIGIYIQKAKALLEKIESGSIVPDVRSLTEAVLSTMQGGDTLVLNIAMTVLMLCWAIAVFDSYRLGLIEDKKNEPLP